MVIETGGERRDGLLLVMFGMVSEAGQGLKVEYTLGGMSASAKSGPFES